MVLTCSCSPNEFKCAKLSSSIDSDRGSILNALGAFDKEDELVSCELQ
jgi:transcription factor SFP1